MRAIAQCLSSTSSIYTGNSLLSGQTTKASSKRSQHFVATLLGETCYARLVTLLGRVAICWVLQIELARIPWRNIFARTRPNEYDIMQHPQMLHEKFDHFQTWANNTQEVETRRNRVANRAQHVAPNNVATCCVQMLRSFGQGLTLQEARILLAVSCYGNREGRQPAANIALLKSPNEVNAKMSRKVVIQRRVQRVNFGRCGIY